jgi:hypothetical protein
MDRQIFQEVLAHQGAQGVVHFADLARDGVQADAEEVEQPARVVIIRVAAEDAVLAVSFHIVGGYAAQGTAADR